MFTNELRAKIASWGGRAFTVLGEEMEEIGRALGEYFTSRTAFDTQKELLISIIVSGCPDEVQKTYDISLRTKNVRSITEEQKEARNLWNQKYRHRIVRIIDAVGDCMFGRILKTKAEVEAELEAERKKQRTVENPSDIASAIDNIAIEDQPSGGGEAMDVEVVSKPKPMDYDLSVSSEAQRYRDDTERYVKTYPDRRPPPPIPPVLKPVSELYNLEDTDELKKFVGECETWNQYAMEINRTHKSKLPLFDSTGKEIEDTEAEFNSDANGYEEVSKGSKKILDVPSSITDDYSYQEEDDEGNIVIRSVTVERIPEKYLKSDTRVAFKGRRSNSHVCIANERDYFATPETTSATILPYLIEYHAGQTIWDSTDGFGEMSNVWKEAKFKVVTTDLYTKKLEEERLDYLCDTPSFNYDVMICNPPFSKKYEFLERAMRLNKPFIMLLPLDMLARKRTAPMLKRGFFKGGVIVPSPRFIAKDDEGQPLFFTESSVTGEKKVKASGVGECFWLFGFPSPDGDDTTQVSIKSTFTVNRGTMGITALTDMSSMMTSCI